MLGESGQEAPEFATGEATVGPQVAQDLRQRLAEEARRCRRYNHFCSVILVRCRGTSPGTICNRVRQQLRSTDYVELVGKRAETGATADAVDLGAGSGDPCEVAAILPETDGAGARHALGRLRGLLPDVTDVKLGLAVYPDDGTDPRQLLATAAASAA